MQHAGQKCVHVFMDMHSKIATATSQLSKVGALETDSIKSDKSCLIASAKAAGQSCHHALLPHQSGCQSQHYPAPKAEE